MKQKIIYLLSIIALTVMSSCADYLDKTPDEDITLEETFGQRLYAERFLTDIYSYLPEEIHGNDDNSRNPFDGAADEMELVWTYPYSNVMNTGGWNATNVYRTGMWQANYLAIRKANIFLANIDKTPMNNDNIKEGEAAKNRWIGEAIFLRALYHFFLVRTHGPIPIVDYVMTPNMTFTSLQRDPINKCFDFIASECDKAAALLPPKRDDTERCRATKAACLALKARALLYKASPLFNGNPDYKDIVRKDGVRLFPDADSTYWADAAKAALECINFCESNGYALYKASSGKPFDTYTELFTNMWNVEDIFGRNMGTWNHQERLMTPNGFGGWSGMNPTQELVDAFEMADGSTPILGYNESDGGKVKTPIINPASGYTETGYAAENDPNGMWLKGVSNMYVNREPRFYACIHFNGKFWRTRQIQFYYSGKDGLKNSSLDYSSTGYCMSKYSDKNFNCATLTGATAKTWFYFRLAEQYLNYAEAINEAEGPAKAYYYVNQIRERAGLKDLEKGLSKPEMRERIHHEREIELCFETHRYFDCNRWKISETTCNTWIHGMNIGEGTKLNDDRFYIRTAREKRVFEKKHYLWPIPQTEVSAAPSLLQSPFWETTTGE
ncbi:MAG: RagB/SusD family nutrient uptake outer membrane protein [Bacteroidota bacterium]|nr:RagB/SusD family nutrient uptake outer membrane protein [Bacteroidota bacterium]